MRPTEGIEQFFRKRYEARINGIMQAQQEACQTICNAIRESAPVDTGGYRDSINVTETVRMGDTIRTIIYSDYTLSDANHSNTPTLPQWADVPLALLIETGTRPHIITPRDPLGALRWEDEDGNVHYAKLVHHTGTAPNPHWSRTTMELQGYYRKAIRRAKWRI